MNKFSPFLAILLLISTLVFSQKLSKDFKISTASPYGVIDAQSKEYVSIGKGIVIMAKIDGEIVYLQKFNSNTMKEEGRNMYKDFPKYTKFQEIIKLEDRVYYLYHVYEKKEKRFKLYSREINTSNASFKSPVLLFTTSRKISGLPGSGDLAESNLGSVGMFSFGGFGSGKKFMTYKSFDESKVMINYRCYPINKDDSQNYDELGFYVFDNTMKKIWGKEVKMPYTEDKMNNVAYAVSNTGEAVMLAALNDKKEYAYYKINSSGKLNTTNTGISTDDKVRYMVMQEDEKGNFLCGGYYANGVEFGFFKGLSTNYNGLMYFEITKDGKVIRNEKYDFSEAFIQQNLSDRQKKKIEKREDKGKAGIFDLVLTDFVIKADGSIYFIGERQDIVSTTYTSGTSTRTKTTYYFTNVIVIKVENNGKLGWMKKLPKYQYGARGVGQMSIAYLEGKNADYVAYVDNPKNISLSPTDGVPAKHADGLGGFLTTYKIDHATGKLEKHTICDLKEINGYVAYQFKTSRILKVSEGVFLMEIYIKKKKDTMVKFELN